jgi:benzoyl-CoA 2,3-dioxygenase component B
MSARMTSIPNNVELGQQGKVVTFLNQFQKQYKTWWDEVSPAEFRDALLYLRCPVGCDRNGWAEFRYVKPQDYQWGLFRTPQQRRSISFGDMVGRDVWQTVPDEHRSALFKHIRVQADAEPGSVEQSSRLAGSAPSLYDLRNLYQFLLEEGRHLWAMVHVLVEHFGAQGEDEAQEQLQRRCGSATAPRLLDAFNCSVDDWLAYFIWCALADRDGKYQLEAVSHAAFDPLARTAAFMLMEEPFHLSIGTHGLERVLARSIELMLLNDADDIFPHGGIPLGVIQKYLNLWLPRVLDLFGSDESSRARDAFQAGLRARANEPSCSDHDGKARVLDVDRRIGGALVHVELFELDALNALMRRQYLEELGRVVSRWNAILSSAGISFRFKLAHERFNRCIGPAAGMCFDPDGRIISPEAAALGGSEWLPSKIDLERVGALMLPELAPGKYAGWISPPTVKIDGKSVEHFQYLQPVSTNV